MDGVSFPDLTALAQHLREKLGAKKFILLYAYNGTGKTRFLVTVAPLSALPLGKLRICQESKNMTKQIAFSKASHSVAM
jgi:ABC-type transport system involved in cytochrome c biogenesis ATPase subunit